MSSRWVFARCSWAGHLPAFILAVSGVLAMLGLQYQAARIVAGICESVYMYSAMRWVVFRH